MKGYPAFVRFTPKQWLLHTGSCLLAMLAWLNAWRCVLVRSGTLRGYRHWRERTRPAGASLWEGLWANWYSEDRRRPERRFEAYRDWIMDWRR
jgi:hypothetical protein